jgi:hypothetical protein
MLEKFLSIFAITALGVASLLDHAQAKQSAQSDFSDSYRCEPDPSTCQWSGQTFSVVREGAILDVKNDKGQIGQVTLTSNISLSAGPLWNMLGVILPDNRTIQWSYLCGATSEVRTHFTPGWPIA